MQDPASIKTTRPTHSQKEDNKHRKRMMFVGQSRDHNRTLDVMCVLLAVTNTSSSYTWYHGEMRTTSPRQSFAFHFLAFVFLLLCQTVASSSSSRTFFPFFDLLSLLFFSSSPRCILWRSLRSRKHVDPCHFPTSFEYPFFFVWVCLSCFVAFLSLVSSSSLHRRDCLATVATANDQREKMKMKRKKEKKRKKSD